MSNSARIEVHSRGYGKVCPLWSRVKGEGVTPSPKGGQGGLFGRRVQTFSWKANVPLDVFEKGSGAKVACLGWGPTSGQGGGGRETGPASCAGFDQGSIS